MGTLRALPKESPLLYNYNMTNHVLAHNEIRNPSVHIISKNVPPHVSARCVAKVSKALVIAPQGVLPDGLTWLRLFEEQVLLRTN